MNKNFFVLFFVFLFISLNQEVSSGKTRKTEEDEMASSNGISKNIKKVSHTVKEETSTSHFPSMVKTLKFPTPKTLARKNRIQRTFWEHALKIEKEGNSFQKTRAR